MVGLSAEDELRQLRSLRDLVRPTEHYELMRDLCQREIELWLGLETADRFDSLLEALRELELTEARQDCVSGLPSRHENFLSHLGLALIGSKKKQYSKLVVCIYMEDICREGQLPRFTAWWVGAKLGDVYDKLWKFDYKEKSTRLMAHKRALGYCLRMKAATAIDQGQVRIMDDYFDAKMGPNMACSYIQQLMNEAYYSPESVARQKLLRAQEVAHEYLDLALKKGMMKCAYKVSVKGARASIKPPLRQNLYQTEFWPHVKEHGGKLDFLDMNNVDQREAIPNEFAEISSNPGAYWLGHEEPREPKIENLEKWLLRVEDAVRAIRGSKRRGPWLDDMDESVL